MRETPPFLYDLRRSGSWNPLSQDLKLIYSTRALTSLYDIRSSGGHLASGQDLKSKYLSRATRGHRNQEFSSKIRAEVREGHGSRVFGTPKSFVFAPRGKEPSYSGLYFI